MEDNGIEFDESAVVQKPTQDEIKLKKIEKELADIRGMYRRFSNEHTSPSMGSDAQAQLTAYRKQNTTDEKQKKSKRHNSTRNMLKEAFKQKQNSQCNITEDNSDKKHSTEPTANTLEEMPVTQECDHTTDTCPTCGIAGDRDHSQG